MYLKKKKSSLVSLAAHFMHNDCYQFTATMVVEPRGDRRQSYTYAVVLSYLHIVVSCWGEINPMHIHVMYDTQLVCI